MSAVVKGRGGREFLCLKGRMSLEEGVGEGVTKEVFSFWPELWRRVKQLQRERKRRMCRRQGWTHKGQEAWVTQKCYWLKQGAPQEGQARKVGWQQEGGWEPSLAYNALPAGNCSVRLLPPPGQCIPGPLSSPAIVASSVTGADSSLETRASPPQQWWHLGPDPYLLGVLSCALEDV